MYDFDHLKEPINSETGVADSFLWAPVAAFTDIKGPTLTASPGTPTPGEEVAITANHTFAAGEGFIEVICSPFKNQFNAPGIGSPGSMKFNPKLEVFVPGSYAKLHEFIKNLKNTPGIALIKDSQCEAGIHYQLGSSCSYCWVTAVEWGTGTNKDGEKGYKVTFETTASAVMNYKGTVTKKA